MVSSQKSAVELVERVETNDLRQIKVSSSPEF
jgi:hypothetical protein